jgi:hypothetical protein
MKLMNAKGLKPILTTVAFVLFTTSMALAGFPGLHNSAGRSADVDFTQTVKVPNGPTLQPGTYKVALLNDSSAPEVAFYRNDKLVGQAPVKLIDQGQKIRQTEVYTQIQDDHSQVITEMDFSGWTEKVVFGGSDAGAASGE